jgi:hypothetical protein
MRGKLFAASLLILPMWLLQPLERTIRGERKELAYGSLNVTRAIRDEIGQEMAVALLAGFRGIVADLVWIQSQGYWERKEWLQQFKNMQISAMLQPRSVLFWDIGAWHMAWNIGYAEKVDTNNYTVSQGLKRERIWHERARDFLERGIESNPKQYELHAALGRLYADKFKDPCRAAAAYQKAAQFADTPSYLIRTYARLVEQCGDKRAAYEVWVSLWSQDHAKVNQLWPVVQREIERLEDILQLPANQRVFPRPERPTTAVP